MSEDRPDGLKPWDIRPDETARAYAAFAVYRGMGEGRTLERVNREYTVHPPINSLKAWSTRHDWVTRARAFDEAAAVMASLADLNNHAEVRARQAAAARVLQEKGLARAEALDPMELAPAEAAKYVTDGAKLERDALGVPPRAPVDGEGQTAETVVRVTIDLSAANGRPSSAAIPPDDADEH